MSINQSFLGRGWSFPPTFNNNNNLQIKMVEASEDIQQSLEILLSTSLGERIMTPDYGCNLIDFLFESINTSKLNFLKEHIRTAIINYETRIELNEISIDGSNYQNGELKISLDYRIEQSNTRFNLVFPFYKVEGTDIPLLYNTQIIQIAE